MCSTSHSSHQTPTLTSHPIIQESHISNLTRFLLSVRQSYLSTARGPPPPSRIRRTGSNASSISSPIDGPERKYLTDKDRDAIDLEAKTIVRQSITVIQNLEAAEKIRIDTERIKYKKLKRRLDLGNVLRGGWKAILVEDDEGEERSGKDAEDEQMRAVRLLREAVIWWLRNRLEKASEIQRDQQETRVMRQVERSKSMLYKGAGVVQGHRTTASVSEMEVIVSRHDSIGGGGGGSGTGKWGSSLPQEEKEDIEQMLSPEQLQIFAKENQDMMKHYEDTLNQARSVPHFLAQLYVVY